MSDFFRGVRFAAPIVFGYLPVGFAFGVLAVKSGITPLAAVLMSLFVYAGSGQLIAAELFGTGMGVPGIVLTTFVVNLRHTLMSAALTPFLKHWSKPRQAWFAFEMTDESFAANLGRFYSAGVNDAETVGLNATAHCGWICGGALGVLLGSAIGDTRGFGLDFALPAMFIALLLPHFAVPRRVLAIFSGAFFAVVFSLIGTGQMAVILGTVVAATFAAFLPAPARITRKNRS